MGKTAINIQNEASIIAHGEHSNGNCDPCIILETGETFTSQIDLANRLEVSVSAVSATICGRQQTCKGYHIISMSRMAEGADLILSRLRETSALEEAGKKWLAYEAEQERIRKEEETRIEAERKAKEEFEAKEQKLADKIQRRRKVSDRMKQGWNDAITRQMEAEREYEELTGHAFDSDETA
jgi:hypothetical protein